MCPLHDQLRALPLQAHGLLADASIGANIKYVIQKLLILEDDVVCLKQPFFFARRQEVPQKNWSQIC